MKITEKIDRITGIPPEYRGTNLPAPKSVKVSLDDRCQFKCSFCSSSSQTSKSRLPWPTFTKLVDELVDAGVEELGVFYIGEPMLDERLADAVRYAKNVGMRYVFCTTNGHLATRKRVRELFQAGLDSLKFSFNYYSGEQIQQVAGVAPTVLGKIIRNIEDAYEERNNGGWRCGIYASSIALDEAQQERMADAVAKIEPFVDEHYWLPRYSFGGQRPDGAAVRGNTGRLDNPRPGVPCFAVFSEGHVTASGDISLCCFDSHSRWVVGNLRNMSFMQAWNAPRAQALRAAHLKGDLTGTECEACVVT